MFGSNVIERHQILPFKIPLQPSHRDTSSIEQALEEPEPKSYLFLSLFYFVRQSFHFLLQPSRLFRFFLCPRF